MADDYATWMPQAEQDWTTEDMDALRIENGRLRAENERLRAALNRYGRHDSTCYLSGIGDQHTCSCGLSDVLARGEGEPR